MAHATTSLNISVLGIPEMVALLHAATDVVDHGRLNLLTDRASLEIDPLEFYALRSAVRAFIPEPEGGE